MAILAAVANIILLIVFIHQIAVSIQADRVISDISVQISKQVETLFPEKMGDELKGEKEFSTAAAFSIYNKSISIKSPKDGFIQYIDSEVLMELVTKHDSILILYQRPGSFLVKGGELGMLYSDKDWGEDAIDDLLDQFVIGKVKTSQQDLEFSIHQMVEIAARALSPGVNDPYTAIACIDNLTATMCYLARANFPSRYRFDKDQKLRIIADVLDFEGVLDAAFNQIRQFSAGSTAVIIRLMEALTTILKFAETKDHKKAVIEHAKMVLRLGKQTIKEKNDLRDLTKRAKEII